MGGLIKTSAIEISQGELSNLNTWVCFNKHLVPPDIQKTIDNLSKMHLLLSQSNHSNKDLLKLIHKLMKITPSSEKGSTLLK